MSALPQFTSFFGQPRVPPPIPTWLRDQSTEQPTPSALTAPFRYVQRQVTNQQESPDFALQGLEGAYVIEGRATVAALDERIQHHEHPKPPEHIGEWQYIQRETLSQRARPDLALKELEQEYVFESRSAVAAFIGQNRLRQLLLDARDPLNAAFGEATVKKLTPVEDDEGFRTLLCLTLIPGDMRAAMLALKSFDEHWWLPRSGQAGGRLNFDFELI